MRTVTHCSSLAALALVSWLSVQQAQSPKATPAPRQGDVAELARVALSTPGAPEMLAQLCASAPKRLSGSADAARAVEWGRQTMLAMGLENVRLEPCTVPHWERGAIERLVVQGKPSGESLRICALGGSPPTAKGGVEAEVVMVKSFDELTALGERARGKAIFFNRPMDPTLPGPFSAYGGAVDQRGGCGTAAFKAGAVCAIVRSMTTALDDFPHTGSMRYEKDATVPSVAVSTVGAERLATLVKAGSVRISLELACQWLPDEPSANVVGEIVGHEKPTEVVVVGGHLDAWDLAQGAHDDGAGCVQALEVARLVKTLGWKPRRTLRVVLWMNEENGWRGAAAYRDAHQDELAQHVFALESDRGGFAPRGFEFDSTGEALETLRKMCLPLQPYGIESVSHSAQVGVDISALQPAGVPCGDFVPDASRYFDFHHSGRDTFENVHPRELELGALCMAAVCFGVADMEGTLARSAVPARPAGH
ncbi:MAG TPA: M20/M25/M40 family metallo-hydrolase [Planctomycetota bacterium]|nr:M20/M25/M40 family metallo-hydrolase [Planctomycetota bacterium]